MTIGTLEWAEDKAIEITERYLYAIYKAGVQDIPVSEYLGTENRDELLGELEEVMDVFLEKVGDTDPRYDELLKLSEAIESFEPL